MIRKFAFTAAAILTLGASAAALADEPGPGGAKPVVSVGGKQVFENVCAACHMQDAKGGTGAGAIPALASNPKLAAPAYPIYMVMHGRGAMPWFYDVLSNQQIADVLTYVRTNFGNDYPAPVTAADVAKLNPAK